MQFLVHHYIRFLLHLLNTNFLPRTQSFFGRLLKCISPFVHNSLVFSQLNFLNSALITAFWVTVEIGLQRFKVEKRVVVRFNQVILILSQLLLNLFILPHQLLFLQIQKLLRFRKVINICRCIILHFWNLLYFFLKFDFLGFSGLVFEEVAFDL